MHVIPCMIRKKLCRPWGDHYGIVIDHCPSVQPPSSTAPSCKISLSEAAVEKPPFFFRCIEFKMSQVKVLSRPRVFRT